MSLENKESQSKKTIVIVIISLLLGVNGLLLWQFFNKKTDLQQTTVTLKNTTAEKETLNAELQKVKFDLTYVQKPQKTQVEYAEQRLLVESHLASPEKPLLRLQFHPLTNQ